MNHSGLRISFEFFPPKTIEGEKLLHKAVKALSETQPDFFSVTYGAGGTTQTGTLDVVKMIQQKAHLNVAPHLTCVGSTRDNITEIINQYKNNGVRRIVALRGDLHPHAEHIGDLKFAYELIALIRKLTHDTFHIEAAAYPEFHPQAENALMDMKNFKQKINAGANSAITQYFFNPDSYFYFLDYCAKLGIYVPVIPGIMPITNFTKLVRFSSLCGAEIPRWIYKRLEAYGDDELSLQSFGLEVVYDLCERLIKGGAPGLHFYTLNQAEATLKLLKMLNLKSQLPVVKKVDIKV